MRKIMSFTAAFLSAGLMLCPVCACAESAVEETETAAEEGQEEEAQTVAEEGQEEEAQTAAGEGPEEEAQTAAGEGQEEEKGGWLAGLQGFLNDSGQAISGLLGEADDAISGAVDGVVSSLSGIGSLLGGLGSLLGGDGFDSFEALMGQTAAIRAAGVDYMLELNSSLMEPGDVQILTDGAVSDNSVENGIAYTLSCFIQQNFTEDEDHVLHLLCEKQDVVLLTLEEQEDGSFAVADAAFAEEGDDYEATLEGFLEYVYTDSVQECIEDIGFTVVYSLPDTLAKYLDEHPDIAGIELEGTVMTAPELRSLRDQQMNEYIDMLNGTSEAESEAEETSEPEL